MKITVRHMSMSVSQNFDDTDVSDCFDVCFGEDENVIFVMVRGKHIEVAAKHGQLIVRPRSGNVVWIDRERFY